MPLTNPLMPALQRLRKRRSPAAMEFLVSDRIDAVNPDYWDRVTDAHSVYFTRAWLRHLEQHAPTPIEPRYVLLLRDGEPKAALVLQELTLESERLLPQRSAPAGDVAARATDSTVSGPQSTPARSLGQRLRSGAKELAVQSFDGAKLLVMGNMLSVGQHAYACVPDLDPALFWHAAAEAIYRIRRAERLEGGADLQLVKDLSGESAAAAKALHDFGYREAETEPNMRLAISSNWSSHGDYLAALSSKYRKNIQSRILKPFEASGWRVALIDDVAAWAERIHALYLAVHHVQSLRPFTLNAGYWGDLPAVFGERLRMVGVWAGEQLVGFICVLLDRDVSAHAWHIGFDRAAAEHAPVYLRLLQASIAEAIALGACSLSLGRTALEPKAALGAKPERMVAYARHRQPLLNKLLRGLLTHIDHDEAPPRNPFKEA